MEQVELIKAVNDISAKLESGYATKGEIKELTEKQAAMVVQLQKEQAKATAKAAADKVFGSAESREIFTRALANELKASHVLQKGDRKAAGFWLERAANLNSEDSGAGVEFVPSLIDPIVNKLITSAGVARSACRVIPGIQGTLNLKNRVTRAPMAFSAAGGVNRGDAALTPAGSTYGTIALTPLQVSGITTIEEKLVFESPINVVEETAEDLAESAAVLEDTALWDGDGTVTYGGYTGYKGNGSVPAPTVTAANFATKAVDYLLQLQTQVHASVLKSPGAAYYMHPYTFATLQQQKASTAGTYFFDPTIGAFKVGGYPIVFSQVMDSTLTATYMPVVFGRVDKATAMGLGRSPEIRVLTETYAASNEIGIRMTYDMNFATVLPTAVAKIVLS